MGNVGLFFLFDVDSFYYLAIPDVVRFCYSVKTESRVLHKPSVYCLFTPKPQHLLSCFKISWETGDKFGSSPLQFISTLWPQLFCSQLSPKKCHSFPDSCYWLARKNTCIKKVIVPSTRFWTCQDRFTYLDTGLNSLGRNLCLLFLLRNASKRGCLFCYNGNFFDT